MLIDTHCHLDFKDFDGDRDAVLERARVAGVRALVNVGSSLTGSRRSVELAEKYSDVYASVGIHPHDAKDADVSTLSTVRGLLESKKIVAVGEIGLDFYRNLSPEETQKKVFRDFIELAVERGLPLIVHCREAQDATIVILKEYISLGLKGVVFHCFSGSVEFLKECLDLGFFVSFTCNVTYPKAQDLKKVAAYVPLDRVFLETDAPFLAPEGRRGKRNEPAFVAEAAREIARLKGVDFEKVCAQTTDNARQFFKLPVEI